MSPVTVEAIPEPVACPISAGTEKVYQGRRLRDSPLWQIVEKHFEEFLRVYDDRFAPTYGAYTGSPLGLGNRRVFSTGEARGPEGAAMTVRVPRCQQVAYGTGVRCPANSAPLT